MFVLIRKAPGRAWDDIFCLPDFGKGSPVRGIPALTCHGTQPPASHPLHTPPSSFAIARSTHTRIADRLLFPAGEGALRGSHEPVHFSWSRCPAYDSHTVSSEDCRSPNFLFLLPCPFFRKSLSSGGCAIYRDFCRESRPDGTTAYVARIFACFTPLQSCYLQRVHASFWQPRAHGWEYRDHSQIGVYSSGIALHRRVVSYPGPKLKLHS
jgi:hypothetical protein